MNYLLFPKDLHQDALELLETLRSAKAIFAVTGAGISTPSGIPDFRGPQGILSSGSRSVFDKELFFRDPKPFYLFAKTFLPLILASRPNPAHRLLVELEEKERLIATATQNIDSLHQMAGSRALLPLHGSLESYSCTLCRRPFPLTEILPTVLEGLVPYCPCGGLIRPEAVLFGESVKSDILQKAKQVASQADLCLVMGSSLIVSPASTLPGLTLNAGGRMVIINRTPTPLDDYAVKRYSWDLAEFSEEVLCLVHQKRFLFF